MLHSASSIWIFILWYVWCDLMGGKTWRWSFTDNVTDHCLSGLATALCLRQYMAIKTFLTFHFVGSQKTTMCSCQLKEVMCHFTVHSSFEEAGAPWENQAATGYNPLHNLGNIYTHPWSITKPRITYQDKSYPQRIVDITMTRDIHWIYYWHMLLPRQCCLPTMGCTSRLWCNYR